MLLFLLYWIIKLTKIIRIYLKHFKDLKITKKNNMPFSQKSKHISKRLYSYHLKISLKIKLLKIKLFFWKVYLKINIYKVQKRNKKIKIKKLILKNLYLFSIISNMLWIILMFLTKKLILLEFLLNNMIKEN